MKIAKRAIEMRGAERELMGVMLDWEKKHRPTWGELISFHSSELARIAKYMVREERSPDDPDQPSGVHNDKYPEYVPLRFYGDVDEFVATLKEHLSPESLAELKGAL